MINIDLLYFEDCPSWESGLLNLKKVIETEKISAKIKLVKIVNEDQAQKEHFLGSPSFRVNGIDLWPEEGNQYILNCRVYKTPSGMQGTPTIDMLKEEIQRIIKHRKATAKHV